jgi:hypothetical protein
MQAGNEFLAAINPGGKCPIWSIHRPDSVNSPSRHMTFEHRDSIHPQPSAARTQTTYEKLDVLKKFFFFRQKSLASGTNHEIGIFEIYV